MENLRDSNCNDNDGNGRKGLENIIENNEKNTIVENDSCESTPLRSDSMSESYHSDVSDKSIAIGRKIPQKSYSTDTISERSSIVSSLIMSHDKYQMKALQSKMSPLAIERSNLVNITKLVIKQLIESSMKFGRMIDSDNRTLNHLFILIEHIMRHGLKSKRGILGTKRELWNVLEFVEKYDNDACDITASSRNLPMVRTSLGKARAWLRLALMKKKLADYFKILIDHRDQILNDFYDDGALMMSEEAIIIGGLLVGLNIIDCNLCIKGEDFDTFSSIIDFSSYLKDNITLESIKLLANENENTIKGEENAETLETVLDQKNYVEELNRNLNSTVANLQQKIEHLKVENALFRDSLAFSTHGVDKLNSMLEKNDHLVNQNEDSKHDITVIEKNDIGEKSKKNEMETLEEMYLEETKTRQRLEKELNREVSLKTEGETARHLLERDVHEKQDTIISLRKQLEDVKAINLQMFNKLQECEIVIKNKTEQITYLEHKLQSMVNSVSQLESKLAHCEKKRSALDDVNKKLNDQLSEREQKRLSAENDLKSQRELYISLQTLIDEQQEQITSLQSENESIKSSFTELEQLKNNYTSVQKLCSEYELSLEEIGLQLRDSKLEVENLKENSGRLREAVWTDDKLANKCFQCTKSFTVARRRHHCRSCGEIFCNDCSNNRMPLPSSAKPVRVCDHCHTLLLERYSAT